MSLLPLLSASLPPSIPTSSPPTPLLFARVSQALSRALSLAPHNDPIHLTTSDDLTGFTIMLLTKGLETEKAQAEANGKPFPHAWPSSLSREKSLMPM